MAHSTINFKHPVYGTMKQAPVGFSWTTFFFGFFPALFRGDFKWAAIIFFVGVAVSIFTFGIGAWVCWIVFGLIYNKMYIRDLVQKGFKVDSIDSSREFAQLRAELETPLEMI